MRCERKPAKSAQNRNDGDLKYRREILLGPKGSENSLLK